MRSASHQKHWPAGRGRHRLQVQALLLGLWLFLAGSAQAQNTDGQHAIGQSPQKALAQLEKELDQKRAALRDLDNKERSLILALGELDQTIAKIDDRQIAAQTLQNQLSTKLATLRKQVAQDRLALDAVTKRLQHRLRAVYVLGRGGAIRHLIGAESFSQLAYRRRLLSELTQADLQLVAQQARIHQVYEERQAALGQTARQSSELSATLIRQREVMAATRRERAAAIARIDSEKELGVARVKENVAQQRELQKLVRRIVRSHPAAAHGKGVLRQGLLRPVPGTIFRYFGLKRENGLKVQSNGIRIRAPLGTPVNAPADGKVVHVGWQRGFGRMVIVDHGEGHHTLFCHLSRALVKRGDLLKRGQTLGFVGDTESLNGPQLYFELRSNGRPRNPVPFFRR